MDEEIKHLPPEGEEQTEQETNQEALDNEQNELDANPEKGDLNTDTDNLQQEESENFDEQRQETNDAVENPETEKLEPEVDSSKDVDKPDEQELDVSNEGKETEEVPGENLDHQENITEKTEENITETTDENITETTEENITEKTEENITEEGKEEKIYQQEIINEKTEQNINEEKKEENLTEEEKEENIGEQESVEEQEEKGIEKVKDEEIEQKYLEEKEGKEESTEDKEVDAENDDSSSKVGDEGKEEREDDDVEEEKEENEHDVKEEKETGDEQIIVAEEVKSEVEEEKIPEDFFYEYDEHSSKPVITPDSGLPLDMLKLQTSYGYDCKRRKNLFLLDEKTVVFAAGNLVQLLNLKTGEQTYIRSSSGCGIGAIAVHPSRKYFAVGEKGKAPNINIFEFPSLKLYRILRGGTEQSYSSLTFNPDGDLLASQGGEPDFMLTVWNWRQEKTSLRTKSFSQDVYCVSFAAELEGQLTTTGSGHIRFWKMADTFTGLKLQGELGRFGRTEISDIEGYVELPDGKVLSGCEWGNLLLWEGGLIKVEICRKGRKSCHSGPIMQILIDEGELMTVGSDGFIRVWDFETMDTADTIDDTGIYELEPMNEMKVGHDVHVNSIVKSVDEDNEPTVWYAQDANGGIWKLDLSFSHTSMTPEKIFSYHAGSVSGCVTSPLSHLAVSCGTDGTVRAYDYLQQKQISETAFSAGATSIQWVPISVDAKASSVVVGFNDGVVRCLTVSRVNEDHQRKQKQQAEIVLQQAFKPHTQCVTCLCFDEKGEILATGSQDGTVFFLDVGDVYEPIGYIEVPGPVRQLIWSPEKFEKLSLMIVCDDGIVVEVDAPEVGNFDTSHSFKMEGLPMRQYTFKSIKSHLRHEEELERERIEEEARLKKEQEERQKRIERGLETESEQGDEEVEKKPKTPKKEWTPFIPEEPSQILKASFGDEPGVFWLSMSDFDAGYLYQCRFMSDDEKANVLPDNIDKPIKAVAVQDSNDTPIHVIEFSQTGQQVIFGLENGQVRIQQLTEAYSLSDLGAYWTLSMHDNNYGHLTSVVQSFDGHMILTTGADGNFFQYSFMSQEELDEQIATNKAKIPSARKPDEKTIDDIDDPNAYSIEDAKQKTEHDRMMRQAEEKKKDVRQHINQLRRQFKTILEQNENLPTHIRLDRMEFEMDEDIKKELLDQTEQKKEDVRKELAFESEKLKVSLEKVKQRFKDVVECERIVVKAFTTNHEVTSFRASKLSEDFYHIKEEFERRKTKMSTRDDLLRDRTGDKGDDPNQSRDGQTDGLDGVDGQGSKVTTTLKGSMGERINNALLKVEEKKRKRAARKAQWEELYENKPDDDYEDPDDVAAIKEAEENMGDYKLKTATDYVVPDHLRMNVEKARGRLLAIKDMIHDYKQDFNVKLVSFRDKKIQLIEEIKEIVDKIKDIQKQLHPSKHQVTPKVPEMHPDEVPERIFEYTRETLDKFKVEYDARKKLAHAGESSTAAANAGFGFGFGGNAPPAATDKQRTPTPTVASKQGTSLTNKTEDEENKDKEELSPLEQEIYNIEQIKLAYEQNRLIGEIRAKVSRFDTELRLMRHDKFRMDIVMKDADLRQVTLFEELVLLKEFEKREDILAEKVHQKDQERLDMLNKILEVQGKVDLKKKDIEKLQEKERNLMATFTGSLGENNKFAEYLTKVFKKRIKRSKKKAEDEEGSDDSSDDESSDDSDWEESDEESDSEAGGYDLDVCPPGCDQKLYDDTCTLREKRLDIEEALTEEKKNLDIQKKEHEALQKKSKNIEGLLKQAQDDLEAFQLEKQQKLNELMVVTTLKFHQIQHVTNGDLSHDLNPALVFESDDVTSLQHRIKELEHEKSSQKKHMKESRKKHVQLIKDRKEFEGRISSMEETCVKLMLDKFGVIVDMETIETVTVNRALEELKEKLHQVETECVLEIKSFDEEINDKKEEMRMRIRDNTARLTQLAMLLTEQNTFTNTLDNRQKRVGIEYHGHRKQDIREKQRLIQLVQLQAQEVDALKEEIMLLSKKGGHILPPTQPPLPPN